MSIDADKMLENLVQLIRQPSVSATGDGIKECALLVAGMLKGVGISSKLLRIRGAAPAVYGRVKSDKNPDKTILFYNHYDVQPAESTDEWKHPPFAGVRMGNKIFGRGSTDDKGELVTRIAAVQSLLDDPPCNVIFLTEGEEEIGSPNIQRYISKYRRELECDCVIWEFGYVDGGVPLISLGMKGLLYAEITARGPSRDVHSSLAPIIPNPAWKLVEVLNSIKTPSGRIRIRGWYDSVKPLTGQEKEVTGNMRMNAKTTKMEYGIRQFLNNMDVHEAKRQLVAGPTCNIAGMESGYTGHGAKTILPAHARAKIDFRLVPGMDPKAQTKLLKKHLAKFKGVSLKTYHAEAAHRTDISDGMVARVRTAFESVYGSSDTSISSAGTGPMHAFGELGAPCISVGSTPVFSPIHAPNEYADTVLLEKTAESFRRFLTSIA